MEAAAALLDKVQLEGPEAEGIILPHLSADQRFQLQRNCQRSVA